MVFPGFPGWATPIGLGVFLAGTGVFFWGLYWLSKRSE